MMTTDERNQPANRREVGRVVDLLTDGGADLLDLVEMSFGEAVDQVVEDSGADRRIAVRALCEAAEHEVEDGGTDYTDDERATLHRWASSLYKGNP